MRAARAYPITEHTTDVRIEHVDEPRPRDGEVLVQVTAAGVTPLDHCVATGRPPPAGGPDEPGRLPLILGGEGAGIVAADPGGQ